MIYSQTGSYTGYGFAIPTTIMNKVVADLKEFGIVQRAQLGVKGNDVSAYIDSEKAKGNEVDLGTVNGVYVAEVVANGTAAEAGLKEGDVVTAINGKEVKKMAELQEAISLLRPGDKVKITYMRNKKKETVSVVIRNAQGNTKVLEQMDMEQFGAALRPIDEQTKQQLNLPFGLEVVAVKKGKMEASEAVDHLAQNLTGTSLMLLGYALAQAGLINGAGDDDKEGKYDYQLGKQAYSINIGGSTYSLSWLAPTAMPLFIGANAYETLVEGQEWTGDVVVEALAQTLDPLSEMSFLSSLDDVLSSYDSGVAKFAGIASSAAQSYVSQYIPTLVSQIATVTDDKKRTTKVASDSNFKFVDETINQLKYKIPGLRQTLEPSTDIWGKTIYQNDDIVGRAVETFIAPYSRKELIGNEIDSEIKDLYNDSGDTGVIPSIPGNTFTYKKQKYEMSEEEYTEYKKVYGRTANILLERLFATNEYQNATAKKKAAMVKKVYDIALDDAKENFLEDRED
jgi:hypothetical protein